MWVGGRTQRRGYLCLLKACQGSAASWQYDCATTKSGPNNTGACALLSFFSSLHIRTTNLPNQALDKHKKNSKKTRFKQNKII
jgi:hypothetical protein